MTTSSPLDRTTRRTPPKPLKGLRALSLALNLPGPAALMRLRAMGATCTKVEPPSGDPMHTYSPVAYDDMHAGIKVVTLDLKQATGQRALHRELARTDVLLTSFRPSALNKLGLNWKALHTAHPRLCLVSIVGAPGARAEEPGHDLTYLAEHDLVQGLTLPATLYADMGGALASSEAVLQVLLLRQQTGAGVAREVALSEAAGWLAKPRHWNLTRADGDVGGAHAGYRVYACQDGRVAVAALEPHFAARLAAAAGLPAVPGGMHEPATARKLAAWFKRQTCAQLDELAHAADIPLHTLPPQT